MTLTEWEVAARRFEPPVRRWATPGALAQELDPGTVQTPALDVIDAELVRLADAAGQARLMVFMAPQEGKSTRVSHRFVEWYLLEHPDHRVAIVSHGDDLARQWGAAVKNDLETFNGDDGVLDLGLRLRADTRAAGRWQIEGHRGGVYCVSIGGSLTGRAVDLLLVDDPLKDLEQAQSSTYRARAHRFWQGVAVPRMAPHTKTVIVQCIVASMRVLTGEGRWTPIEDMRSGDTVVSLDADRTGLLTAKVTAQRLSGYDQTYRVRTDRLTLGVNGQHPFAVLRRGKARPNARDIEWVQAADLAVGDIAVTAKSLPDDHHGFDLLVDGSTVDDQRAWLLGYLIGDGWVTAHKRVRQAGNPTSYAVCCAMGKSRRPEKADLNTRILAALEAWSPNRVYETSVGYWRTDWNAGGRVLTEMGYGAGAKHKRVPDVVWSWSPPRRRAFIKGYVEADGSLERDGVRSEPVWVVGSSSRALLDDVRDLALTCGVRPANVFTDKPRTHHPPNSPTPVVSILHTLRLTFSPDVAEGRSMVTRVGGHPAPQHLRYERIRSVTPGPVEPVYDLTVEGTESFIAEGFAVHNTRWHEDDLSGWLLAGSEADRWRVVSIPAIAEADDDVLGRQPGEPMVSARGVRDWAAIRADIGEFTWAALYQQRPAPAAGGLFKRAGLRHWARVVGDPRPGMLDLGGVKVQLQDLWRFLTVDLAASTKTSADYTVAAVWGITLEGALVLLDGARRRVDPAEHWPLVRGLREKWSADTVFVESRMFGTTLVYEAGRAFVPVSELKADTDKLTRALPAAARADTGRLWLPPADVLPDVQDWIDELVAFPNAVHDDVVDVVAYAARVAAAHWLPGMQAVEAVARRQVRAAREPAMDDAFASATGVAPGGVDYETLAY